MAKVIINGVAGCIGSWVARHLLEHGHTVVGVDLAERHPLAALLGMEGAYAVERLDIREREQFTSLVERERPDAVIHLVSMLMPACKADAAACVEVNVQTFATVLDLARRHGFNVVYASSAWVLNAPPGTSAIGEEGWVDPQSLYGVFKLANEGMSRVYAKDYGITSNGLRPYIVYGPGRERGLTADVNLALLAASRGESYRIGFGGHVALHHVSDVARAFIRLALEPVDTGRVYNVRGSIVNMAEIVSAIEAATRKRDLVTFVEDPLPIAADLDDARLQKDYGPLPFMALVEGFKRTLDVYQHGLGSVES